jgi:hypothetical protein
MYRPVPGPGGYQEKHVKIYPIVFLEEFSWIFIIGYVRLGRFDMGQH